MEDTTEPVKAVLVSKWRNPYDEAENKFWDEYTSLDCTGDPGMTLQAPAEEQDLNVIMKRFGVKDGSRLPYWQDPGAIFGDFSELPTDPVEAAEALRQGNIAFQMLPAEIQRRFQSGPELYNWLNDTRNTDEAVKLGLLAQPVSISTSSDKEPLVPPSNPPAGGGE